MQWPGVGTSQQPTSVRSIRFFFLRFGPARIAWVGYSAHTLRYTTRVQYCILFVRATRGDHRAKGERDSRYGRLARERPARGFRSRGLIGGTSTGVMTSLASWAIQSSQHC